MLAMRMRRMPHIQLVVVSAFEEACRLCRAGEADACVVDRDEALMDAPMCPDGDAPGRGCGVPSLMVVPAMTPYHRALARRGGYAAAVPADVPARVLYRRLGAMLQRRNRARLRAAAGGRGIPHRLQPPGENEPTVH